MAAARGTTPTFTLDFTEFAPQGFDLTTFRNVLVTFRAGAVKITKKGEDLQITEKTIEVLLDQAETLLFYDGAKIQVNWITASGRRGSSEIAVYPFDEQLLDEVVE